MCGIVGLFFKHGGHADALGPLLLGMLDTMRDRGPDSAGFAVYADDVAAGRVKLTVRAPDGTDFAALACAASAAIDGPVSVVPRASHAVISVPATHEDALRRALTGLAPSLRVVGAGRRIELYKDVGLPADVARRFDLGGMSGTHGIGHTRMATESAVTIDGAHPYTTGHDFCLVHNGSLSNHNSLRRMLVRAGLAFTTENDTEVAAGYIAWRLRAGDDLPHRAGGLPARPRRLLHLRGRHRDRLRRAARPDQLQACRDGGNRRLGRVRFGIPCPGRPARHRPRPGVGTRAGARLRLGSRGMTAAARTFDLAEAPVRALNAALHALAADSNETTWQVLNPRGRHALAVGITHPLSLRIDGHVGYYCAGMNQAATVAIHGNAGVGVAENMMSGRVHVHGDASAAAGATAHGGMLVIDGNAAARCGISMKGIDIVVGGNVGHMSAFMAQAGTLTVLGDAGDSLGDSIYEARLFVRGRVASLGADCIEKDMRDRHRALLRAKLDLAGIGGQVDVGAFRRYGSARKLYHFHVDNAGQY